jgi:hypothetical protein
MSIRWRRASLLLSLLLLWTGNRCEAIGPVCPSHPARPVQRDVVPLALRYRQHCVATIALPSVTPNVLHAPRWAAPSGWGRWQDGPPLPVPPDGRCLYLLMSLQR